MHLFTVVRGSPVILSDPGSRYGYGANIPTTARRRLQQSVALARKLLAAQRKCAQLERDLAAKGDAAADLQAKLDSSTDLLRKASQPYHYLVETVQQRDATVGELRIRLQIADKEVGVGMCVGVNVGVGVWLRVCGGRADRPSHCADKHSTVRTLQLHHPQRLAACKPCACHGYCQGARKLG